MSENGVDDNVELHLIDTRQLVEEARKISQAKRLTREAETTKKKLFAGVSPLGTFTLESANLPKGFFTGAEQTRRTAISGARTDNAFREQQKKQADLDANLVKLRKELDDKLKKMEKEQKEFEDKLFGGLKTFGGIMSGGTAGLPSAVLSQLSRFGLVGAIIAGSLSTIEVEMQKQFERGGALSTKLKVLPQALTLNDVNVENAERAGTKYISSDLRIVQRAPQSSNTSNIKWESIRYTMDNLGR
jgi:hypothetical protein